MLEAYNGGDPIREHPMIYGARYHDNGTGRGNRRGRGEGPNIGKGEIPGKRVTPKLLKALIWGSDTITKKQLCQTSEELPDYPYQNVRVNGGV